MAVLLKMGYLVFAYSDDYELKAAKKLEKRFPEQILKFCKLGTGKLNCSSGRKDYARKAKVMNSVCHMYVDILNTPEIWLAYAQKIKQDNARRLAFQEEFAKIIPGWKEL